jgi:hypothetical protein
MVVECPPSSTLLVARARLRVGVVGAGAAVKEVEVVVEAVAAVEVVMEAVTAMVVVVEAVAAVEVEAVAVVEAAVVVVETAVVVGEMAGRPNLRCPHCRRCRR